VHRAVLKSHHFADHDEFWSKLLMNREQVQNAEGEQHVVKCEYNSSCIETPVTDGYWNAPKYKTHYVRDDRDYVKNIPFIKHIADELEPDSCRVIHYDLHNKYQLFSYKKTNITNLIKSALLISCGAGHNKPRPCCHVCN